MNNSELNAFMIDPDLEEMQELVKISDDIFDVIRLSENQHSDMLAWCLNPNEGHAQGDAVIKDFLIAAHTSSVNRTFDNKKFFEFWTPARIRSTNFGAAFISREFSVVLTDGKGRLDLFLVDPTNRLVVAIENKAGAMLDKNQLDRYCESVNRDIGSRVVFKTYHFAYVVLDRDLDYYEESYIESLGTRWSFLDYSWLKASAKRARHHLARSNQAAQLLMAYCQNQTDWEKQSQKKISELAADLAIRHEEVVGEMRLVRRDLISEWTPTMLASERGNLIVFANQNRQLCNALFEGSGIGAIQAGLKKGLQLKDVEYIDIGRTWLAFMTQEMASFSDVDAEEWPIYIAVYRNASKSKSGSKFTVKLILSKTGFLNEDEIGNVKTALLEKFPGLGRFFESGRRRLQIDSNLDASNAIEAAIKTSEEVSVALRFIQPRY